MCANPVLRKDLAVCTKIMLDNNKRQKAEIK